MSARARRLVCALALAGSQVVAQAQAVPPNQPATTGALSALPPEASVRRVLENLPQFRLGGAAIALATAEQEKLLAGPYEWTVRSSVNARTVSGGGRYTEQDIALERTVRWFGKADQDRAVGRKGVDVARARFADLWHEAARSLLKDWFDALRDRAALARLQDQRQVARELHDMTMRRVRAGDAAALEQQLAATEVLRIDVLSMQAQQRLDLSLAQLDITYVGLPTPEANQLPLPQADVQGPQYWYQKILSDNHELELAQAEADLSALRARRIASDRMPDPTVAVRAARERDGQERLIGLTVSMPLPGAGRSADASAAAIKARAAAEGASQAQTRVRTMAMRAVIDATRTYEIWQSLHDIETQSMQQAQLLLRAYEGGDGSLADVLAARRRALEAALLAQAAQIDALAAFARVRLDAHMIWAID